jgi:hypothetical protein
VCTLKTSADGSTRCLPNAQVVVFTDADCKQPIAIAPSNSDCRQAETPAYGVEIWGGDSICRGRSRSSTYEIGGPIDLPPVVYNQTIFGCVKRTPPSGETYPEAKAVSLDDWVKFERTSDRSVNRFQYPSAPANAV